MTRTARYIALALVIALAGACNRQAPAPEVILRVGYVPIADCLPLYVALERGLFTSRGLKVEVTQLQSGQRIIEAMGAGELEVGISNVVSTVTAHARGIPVVSFTGGAMETPERTTRGLMVLADSPIKTPADLVGKRVAVNGLRNIEHVKLRQYLELHKVPIDKVEVVEAPFPQMEGVLRNGSVAAAMANEPFLAIALKHGSVRILGRPYTETSPRTFVSSYVAMRPWLDGNTDAARKFAQAIAEATAFVNANPDESRKIVLKYIRVPEEVSADFVLPYFEPTFDATALAPMVGELARQAIIPSSPDPAAVFRRF
jgi:NitT/TauT family transport system substrate-binding protein